MQQNNMRGDSFELRRLKPDPLNLAVKTGVGKQYSNVRIAFPVLGERFFIPEKVGNI